MRTRAIAVAAATLLLVSMDFGSIAEEEMPARAAGLWELVKNVADDPRPLPVVKQCTDQASDGALGWNAFLVNYDTCSSFSARREGDRWLVKSVCDSPAGEMRTDTLLSGDFRTQYRMEQSASIKGEIYQQTVVVRRLGNCEPNQKPGTVYLNGEAFDLADVTNE